MYGGGTNLRPLPPAPSTNHSLFLNKSLSNLATLLPREQRLHFRCVSCRAKSSLCWQPFNFLSCLREIHHAICKENLSSGLSSNGASFAGIKKMRQLWSATQDSHNALNRKKPGFFYLFVQISGRIWTVVGRGYFSHDSSHSENIAPARKVQHYRD